MKKEWYKIKNIDKFVESTRVMVYSSFGSKDLSKETININIDSLKESELSEMNTCLSQNESMVIVKDFIKLSKNNKEYMISDKNYYSFIEALNARLVSNIINKLSQDGILESAFDAESNDFVFWIKNTDEKEK